MMKKQEIFYDNDYQTRNRVTTVTGKKIPKALRQNSWDMKKKEKTYFDFARWLSINYYQFLIKRDGWINKKDADVYKGRTYTDEQLFKIFINEIKD